MRHVIRLAVLGLVLSILTPVPSSATEGLGEMGRYIVVLEDGASVPGLATRAIAATGGEVGFLYEHAIRGFAIELPTVAVNRLRRLPGVASVEPDIEVHVAAETPSTGYDRIEADLNPGGADYGGVDIAIIDTGVWWDTAAGRSHEDLNLRWVTDCTGAIFYPLFGGCSAGGVDGNGHGTHVAGIAAACDNDIGVRGVAPCATLWSFKVLGDDGTGYLGSILAAVDSVAANADQIEVANMSLVFEGQSQALTDAINAAVAAGVVFVVAAGNSADDAALYSPASIDSAITVSAVSDYDGAPGGLAAPGCRTDADDTFASYSNFGAKVDIAAPGSCILSTYLNDGYGTFSGTSMASPMVAGAAARYLYDNGIDPMSAADVAAVRAALVNGGAPQTGSCGFTGDPDGIRSRFSSSTVRRSAGTEPVAAHRRPIRRRRR
jgi:subtilisin